MLNRRQFTLGAAGAVTFGSTPLTTLAATPTQDALVIDAMDVMYTKDIDVMCFVSSDCDFTPLVTRVLAEGKVVLGFGERKTPRPDIRG